MSMGGQIGDGYIEIAAEDGTADGLKKIQAKLISQMRVAAEKAGRELIDEFERAGDQAGDRMLHEIEVDAKRIEHVLNELEKDRHVSIEAEANTKSAAAQLMYASRDRFVNFWVRLRGNVAADLARIVKGLAGYSMLKSWTDAFTNFAASLPQTTLRLSLLAGAFVSLINPIMSAMSAIGPLGASLGQIFPLILAGPAALGAVAASIGIVVAAFMKLSEAAGPAGQDAFSLLEGLKSRFSALQDIIQENFWSGFVDPLREMTDLLMPQLEAGLSATATTLGGAFGAMASGIARSLGETGLQDFFANLDTGISNAIPGLGSFAQALTTIAEQGARLFPQFGTWLTDIGNRFNGWAQSADIAGLIQNAATQMGHLYDAGVNTWRIVSALFKSMDIGKSTGLESFAATLGRIAEIVEGPTFQTAMNTVFTGASAGASALSAALVPIGNSLAQLAPTISNLLSSLGGGAADALTGIAAALASPAAQSGLNAAIQGVADLLSGIDWNAAGAAVGALGTAIGDIAPRATALVNAILPYLPPILEGFGQFSEVALSVVSPLVQLLSPLAQIEGIVPMILTAFLAWKGISAIITGVQAVMVTWQGVMAGVAAAQAGVNGALNLGKAGIVGWAATVMGQGIAAAARWVASMVSMGASAVAQAAVASAAWVASVARTVASLTTQAAAFVAQKAVMVAGAAATGLVTAAQWALNAAMSANPIGIIIVAITALIGALVWFFTQTEVGQAIWGEFTRFIGEAWTNIMSFLEPAITLLGEIFTNVFNGISAVVQFVIGFISDYIMTGVGLIVGIFTGDFSLVPNVVQDVFRAISDWITNLFGGIIDWIVSTVSGFVTNWNTFWGLVQQGITIVWNAIVSWVTSVVSGFVSWIISAWNGYLSFWSGLWDNVSNTIHSIWNGILSWFQSIPSSISNIFSGAINWLVSAGQDIIQGLWNGLKGIWESVSNWFQDTVGGIADTVAGLFGIASPSKLFTYFGEMMTAGLVKGLEGMEEAASRKLSMELRPFVNGLDGMVPSYNASGDTVRGVGSTTTITRTQNIEAGAFALTGPNPADIALQVYDAIAEESDY